MESFGYCNLSAVPVRASASHTSEMVNQLLFGEVFEILDHADEFLHIRGTLDKYEGFISRKQYLPLTKSEFEEIQRQPAQFPANPITIITESVSGEWFRIVAGSSLRGFQDGRLAIAGKVFVYSEPLQQPGKTVNPESLIQTAIQFLGAPYLWGGRSLFGIDCSGLTQVVYNIHGVALQRDARYQAQAGETIHLLSESMPGDLAFFDNEDGIITHVGIILPDHRIIHASGVVQTGQIDHHGIYDRTRKNYSHKLRLIKRVIG